MSFKRKSSPGVPGASLPSLSGHTEEKPSDPDRNCYLSFSAIPCFQGCQRRWAGGRWGSGAVGQGHSRSRLMVERCCALLVGLGPLRAVQPTLPAAPAGHACQVSALGTELPQMPVPRGQAWFPLSPDHLTLTSWVFSATSVASLCEVWEIASQTSGSSSSLPARRTVAGVGWVHRLSTCPSQGQSPSPIPNRWTLHAGPSCSPFQAPAPLHTLILMGSWSMQALRMRCKYISTPWCYGPKHRLERGMCQFFTRVGGKAEMWQSRC